jgi:hypothetical protein
MQPNEKDLSEKGWEVEFDERYSNWNDDEIVKHIIPTDPTDGRSDYYTTASCEDIKSFISNLLATQKKEIKEKIEKLKFMDENYMYGEIVMVKDLLKEIE